MATHDHNGAGEGPNTPEEERTARICAHLLGELPAAESTLLEAELAANPELQAEADLLAATIGAVQSGLRTEPALPAAALASLTAAAAQPLREPQPAGRVVQGRFSTQSATKAAAAVLVLMGGSLLYLQGRVETRDRVTAVALSEFTKNGMERSLKVRLERSAPGSASEAPASGMGYLDGGAAGEPGVLNAPVLPGEVLKGTKGAQPGIRATDLGVYEAGGGSEGSGGLAAADAAEIRKTQPVINVPHLERKRLKAIAGGEAIPGSDGSVRAIERQLPAGESTPPTSRGISAAGELAAETATTGVGTFRGPGDSAPPGSGSTLAGARQEPQLVDPQDVSPLLDYWRFAGTSASGGKTGGAARVAQQKEFDMLFRRGAGGGAPNFGAFFDEGAGSGYRRRLENLYELQASGKSSGSTDGPGSPGPSDFYLGRGGRLQKLKEHQVPMLNEVPTIADLMRSEREEISEARKLRNAQALAEHYLQRCRPLPGEQPRDMYFRYWGDNPYVYSSQDSLATFAADVDTASYNLARRYLVEGKLPTKAQVRTEEFVNAFQPDVPAPTEGTFAVQTELAPSPFGGSEARWMLRVTVRGKEVAREERDPLALTFVVDTSGSMKEDQRLELVKHALRLLVSQLEARDSIALVAFSDHARLVLPMTPVSNRAAIESAIHPLAPKGGTNAEAGLTLGYELAASALSAGTHHRVVFLSDGVANIGQTNQDQLSAAVQHRRDQGIYLNTIGVGMNNHNDVFLEQLADKGDGICDYVDDGAAVERAIVERFTGAFVPIASDVKIQVEFDPSQVLRWRQIGYENRAVADADFRNDAVDAGEIGAGHQVTALFEVERVSAFATNTLPPNPLAQVRLRWKQPKGAGIDPRETTVFETDHAVGAGSGVGRFASASPGYQRAVLVAQYAEVLRRSSHATSDSVASLVRELERVTELPGLAGDQDTVELLQLVKTAAVLGAGQRLELDALGQTVDEYQRHLYLNAQLRMAQASIDDERQAQLKATNDALEQRIRELCLEKALR